MQFSQRLIASAAFVMSMACGGAQASLLTFDFLAWGELSKLGVEPGDGSFSGSLSYDPDAAITVAWGRYRLGPGSQFVANIGGQQFVSELADVFVSQDTGSGDIQVYFPKSALLIDGQLTSGSFSLIITTRPESPGSLNLPTSYSFEHGTTGIGGLRRFSNGRNRLMSVEFATAVPEPGTLVMSVAGLSLMAGIAARRRRHSGV